MATTALIGVEEYLARSYEPDREYVAGRLVERHVGEYLHSRLQGLIFLAIYALEAAHAVRALVEQRLRVDATPGAERYRVPDVCLVAQPVALERGALAAPPLVIVEVLSPEDTLREVMEKTGEYLRLGVDKVYVADPYERLLYEATAQGLELRPQRRLEIPRLGTAVELSPLFEELTRQ